MCTYELTLGLNYLVQVDSDGKLRWSRNGELVDTTAGRWTDGGHGRGIVPMEHPEPTAIQHRHSFVTAPSSPSSESTRLSGGEVEQVMHYYAGRQISRNPVQRILWRNFTLRGLLDRLLRKTIKRNTWIYVSVSSCYLHERPWPMTIGFLPTCRTRIVS